MAQKTSYTYTLPSGAEIEIEAVEERKVGAADVSFQKEEKIPFDKVINPLGEITQLLFEKIKSSAQQPDTVSLEFNASLKGQTKLLIFSGEGEGGIKVTLTWNKQ